MTYHFLKIEPRWFNHIITRKKSLEIRKDDRGFHALDRLVLMEYHYGHYTGRFAIVMVRLLVTHDMFPDGIKRGYCLMGIEKDIHPSDLLIS